MQADLVLSYKHDMTDTKEHVCTGDLKLRYHDGELPPKTLWEFEKKAFNKLLAVTSEKLNDKEFSDIKKVVFLRTDKVGLKPVVLDNPTVELLRSNPVAAIRAMSFSLPSVAETQEALSKMRVAPIPLLKSGYDTLSDSVGAEVYCRMHKGLVECPGCGMWSTGNNPFICKKKCRTQLKPVDYTLMWVRFDTFALLNLKLSRYYLARAFNHTPPWISHEELSKLYDQWLAISKKEN